MNIPDSTLPHGSNYVAVAGNTTNPTKALLLIHGRGASADNIMQLTAGLTLPEEYIVLAPQAANHTWYPQRFIVPQAENQPQLDSALDRIRTILSHLKSAYEIDTNHIILSGFSQGACLVSEYLNQHPNTYKAVAIYSGGLIGDDSEITHSGGYLEQTPVYIGCDLDDFHIPKERVITTADILTKMGAAVDLKLYEGLGHAIHPEGLAFLQSVMSE